MNADNELQLFYVGLGLAGYLSPIFSHLIVRSRQAESDISPLGEVQVRGEPVEPSRVV